MSSATAVGAAATLGFGCHIVFRALRLPWIPDRIRPTIERLCFFRPDRLDRFDKIKLIAIRLALVQLECLIAHRHPLAALQRMAVVVNHFAPGAFVDDRLIALKARALLAFEGADSNAAEFDAMNRLPRRVGSLDDLD